MSPWEWEVDSFGLRFDRRWMVVDASGRLISQRTHPRLALVRPTISEDLLRVEASGMPELELLLHPSGGVSTSVVIWGETCAAWRVGERAARWFSELLETACSLVYMPDSTLRPVAVAPGETRVSFADAFPFLLISEESLADLNLLLAAPIPMNRFRPNLVVRGCQPYGEDLLDRFRIGAIRFQRVKACARCAVPTVDQATGERGSEPLRTLATYRRREGEVFFGQNLIHYHTGRLRVGNTVLP